MNIDQSEEQPFGVKSDGCFFCASSILYDFFENENFSQAAVLHLCPQKPSISTQFSILIPQSSFLKMTSRIEYLGDLRLSATHLLSGTTILTDAPPDNQGRGEAFSPTDLCATSLGCCMMTIMGISARAHKIDMTGATAEVQKIMAADPRRIARIELKIQMPDKNYTEKQKKILETAAKNCPVSLSLNTNLEEVVQIIWH